MNRAHRTAFAIMSLAMLVGAPAQAQDGSSDTENASEAKPDEDIYKGIIPGKRDNKEHISKSAARKTAPTKVTWIGFLPQDTRTRVFIQTDGSSEYDMTRGDDGKTITITIPSAKLADRNLRRDIDASYHKRSVSYIKISDRKKMVTLTMTIKEGSDPRVSTSGNYINIDFAHSPKDDT